MGPEQGLGLGMQRLPVGGAVQGSSSPPANVATITAATRCAKGFYESIGGRLALAHIKAHDGGFFNEVADCVAKAGAAGWFLSGTPLLVGDVVFMESSV